MLEKNCWRDLTEWQIRKNEGENNESVDEAVWNDLVAQVIDGDHKQERENNRAKQE